jgi:hypothetical protein
MANLYAFPVVTSKDLLPEQVLQLAAQDNLKEVVVIGFDADGQFCFRSAKSDGANALWLLEVAKTKLLKAGGA